MALKQRIDETYTRYPFYGSRRRAVHLRREGVLVNRKAVQRHRRAMGIAGIAPGPSTRAPGPDHPVYPYLLRPTTRAYRNHVWGSAITYIRLGMVQSDLTVLNRPSVQNRSCVGVKQPLSL